MARDIDPATAAALPDSRGIEFTAEDMARLRHHAAVLGTSMHELIEFCVRQGLDELDSLGREYDAIRAYWEAVNGG